MLTLENLLLFVPTMGLLVMLPGPDFALVSKIFLFQGKRHGKFAALGVTAGMCVHTLLAMFGISAIIASSSTLFMILKYAGTCYLCYIGFMSIIQSMVHITQRNAPANRSDEIKAGNHHGHSFWCGFMTNVLNPKAILYFMVLLPQFITTGRPLTGQFLELGVITALLCMGWYLFLASLLDKVRTVFIKPAVQKWLHGITGGIFVMFGVHLALERMD